MNYKSILLDQLNACYNDKSWFIPLHEILIDLNGAQAAWETESKSSIWSIVNHLIFWNEKWLERYNAGHFELESSLNNDDTFYVDPHSIDDLEWKKTLQRLENVFYRWNRALEESTDSKLISVIPSYYNAPWWGVVSNLSIHNAYHIGQIMLLKKQLLSSRK
ncbi:DinB family protein [Paenibacillus provencensis]|uniref:DinB family protein n=1 Tax=Paenibacillus provencensis TaxID=441151 RepID=A0ABW3Q7Y3_9BACL|nr:DinB family protein [Paenibacillus sp. MER 78]MCM3127559.1 DinB family protein [Paenibacillus sp. MER 78]